MTKIILSLLIILPTYFSTPAHALDKLVSDALTSGAARYLSLSIKNREIISSTPSHQIYEVTLTNKFTGDIKLYEKIPVMRTLGRLPTTFILSGLQTGRDAIFLIPDLADMRIITYEYPMGDSLEPEKMLANIGKNLARMNTQIFASYLWLTQQADVDTAKMYSLNISFGSYVAPMPLRALAELGIAPAKTVFAFGGGDLGPFFESFLQSKLNLDISPTKLNGYMEQFNTAMSPTQHLKHLKGPFLIVRGLQDTTIPELSSLSLFDNLSEPKTMVELNTTHINTDKPEVITETLDVVLAWLAEGN